MGRSRIAIALIACAFALHATVLNSITFASEGSGVAEGGKCEPLFKPKFEAVDQAAEAKDLRRAAHQAIPKLKAYLQAIRDRVLERDGLVDLASVALIAEEHLLMMGPPGNAKSQLSDFVLGGMTDAKNGKSYFRIQMTPETTMSETHGPMDYKKLSDTGEYDRLHQQGMGAKRNVFIDEIFDARANAQRNILGMLAERAHAQGSHVIKAEIETVIGATNKYLSEVYEKAGDDGPKAVLDRFALVAFVPANFEETSSYVQLIQRSKKPTASMPVLRFDDVEALRAIVPQVEISVPVAKALALLSSRMKAETEALEAASLKSYYEKVKNGEEANVPYRATKYHSPRTIGKASAILRAFVVRDWVEKNGKRKLEATIQDLAQLVKFFTLNGPSESFVKSEMARTSNKHERAQLMAILQEREIFERHYNKIVEELDGATVQYALSELAGTVGNAKTAEEKQAAAQTIIAAVAKVVSDKSPVGLHSELTGNEIGKDFVQSYLEGLLKGLVSAEEFATMKKTVLQEIERQKREIIERAEAARRKEQERLRQIERETARKEAAERAAAELAERRANELREAFTNPDRFKLGTMTSFSTDPRNGNTMVAYDRSSEKVAIYLRGSDELQIFDTTKIKPNGEMERPTVIERVLGDEKIDGMPIGEIHYTDADTLMLYTTNGKAAMSYKLSTKSVETHSISVKEVATTWDPIGKRTLSFDPSTLKLKAFTDSGSTSEQYKFVDSKTGEVDWNEAIFKQNIRGDLLQLQISDNGNYAVLIDSNRRFVFKVDFVTKEVTGLDYESARSTELVRDSDRSFLHWYDSEVVVVDQSGEEPVVKKFKNESPNRSNTANGASLVKGTNLLLVPGRNRYELVNGADGKVLTEILPGHTPYAIRSYEDGFVMFTNANGWSVHILKKIKQAE